MRYWLVKTEPEVYGWEQLVAEGVGRWDGVRNVQARNNLRQMAVDDPVLLYHSGRERQIVGVGRCVRTAYRDPTSSRAIWSAVDLSPVKPLQRPISLAEVKSDPAFASCPLCLRPRLSVMELEPQHFERLLLLGQTRFAH